MDALWVNKTGFETITVRLSGFYAYMQSPNGFIFTYIKGGKLNTKKTSLDMLGTAPNYFQEVAIDLDVLVDISVFGNISYPPYINSPFYLEVGTGLNTSFVLLQGLGNLYPTKYKGSLSATKLNTSFNAKDFCSSKLQMTVIDPYKFRFTPANNQNVTITAAQVRIASLSALTGVYLLARCRETSVTTFPLGKVVFDIPASTNFYVTLSSDISTTITDITGALGPMRPWNRSMSESFELEIFGLPVGLTVSDYLIVLHNMTI